MADQNEKRTPECNIVHCLKCFKPQENLPVHLARVCMKQSDPEERDAAVKEAKKSFKDWAKAGRMWDYKELSEVIPDKASRYRMMRELLQRGCFVANQPHEHDMAGSAGESTSARTSAGTSARTSAGTSAGTSARTSVGTRLHTRVAVKTRWDHFVSGMKSGRASPSKTLVDICNCTVCVLSEINNFTEIKGLSDHSSTLHD
ncbi:uncharacterized protein LOC115356739 isoform X2 [Myripristis murdjan]|uniref:uncharacterized protein LOC115356739 isoform X2 n=1 Tax=Myripristis murdjan TaxID=586833 RepID=UPI001175F9DD|nr:uncharacterized protein LOC115356739 isoform X2 [Myripristis murdjan]